jgi:hypothetical protein
MSPCVGAGENGVNIGAFGIGCGTTSLDDGSAVEVFRLNAAHPNPFGNETNFDLELARRARVGLRIYDTGGRLVSSVPDAEYPPGPLRIDWNARCLPGGVYYYRIAVGEDVFTGRLVKMR